MPFLCLRAPNSLTISYLVDWLVVISLGVATIIIDVFTDPFDRQFSVADLSIAYPHAAVETIPYSWVIILACVMPAVIIAVYAGSKRNARDANAGLLGLAFALAATVFLTELTKNVIGEHRPDFLDRCQPSIAKLSNGNASFPALYNSNVCSTPPGPFLSDGMQSFPSGHSSTAFAGLTYLSVYLAGKMRVFDHRSYMIKLFFFLPTLLAAWIGMSRIRDYRHHWHDVVVGGALGVFLAVGSYYYLYPSLLSPGSADPFDERKGSQPDPENPRLPSSQAFIPSQSTV